MKVLVVEDDETVRGFLLDVVAMEGHEGIGAVDGREGLDVCRKNEPHVIITDIEMPELNGLEMLEKIRRFDNESIGIIVTGHGNEEYAIQALRLGAHNYLKKPVRHTELISLLRKYDSVIRTRTIAAAVPGITVNHACTMKFDNCLETVDKVVDYLVSQAGEHLSRKSRLSVHLALLELLVNSMEHGNLEITFEEKARALENNTLQALRDQRRNDPNLSSRKVTVEFKSDDTGCEWVIADEGRGFDWRTVPNPLERGNLMSHNGRGIAISRRHFDEFEYVGSGNVVRAKKYPDGGSG
jgi:DNA-binding response OmpR family regulator